MAPRWDHDRHDMVTGAGSVVVLLSRIELHNAGARVVCGGPGGGLGHGAKRRVALDVAQPDPLGGEDRLQRQWFKPRVVESVRDPGWDEDDRACVYGALFVAESEAAWAVHQDHLTDAMDVQRDAIARPDPLADDDQIVDAAGRVTRVDEQGP